jgi:hypothetical protein
MNPGSFVATPSAMGMGGGASMAGFPAAGSFLATPSGLPNAGSFMAAPSGFQGSGFRSSGSFMATPSAFPATGSFLAQPSGMGYGYGGMGMGGLGFGGYASYSPSPAQNYMRPWQMVSTEDDEAEDTPGPMDTPSKSKYKPLSSAKKTRSVVQKQRKSKGKKGWSCGCF